MFANCLKNNYVNSLYAVYVLVLILHVRYGNHRKMLGLTCLNTFLCMYVCNGEAKLPKGPFSLPSSRDSM
jgi:hypothetical protein